MRANYISYGSPQFRLLSDKQIEELHFATLQIIEKAGVAFECSEAIALLGNAGADVIGTQATAEIAYQILVFALSGTDLVHNVGLMYKAEVVSPELIVLGNEIIDMVKVLLRGMEINEETLPLDLIIRLGPRATYLTESHTRQHFREFWMPRFFDRSFIKKEDAKNGEEMLNQRTIEILETHQPKPLPEDLVRELKKMEKTWFDRVGLKHEYPKRERVTGSKH